MHRHRSLPTASGTLKDHFSRKVLGLRYTMRPLWRNRFDGPACLGSEDSSEDSNLVPTLASSSEALAERKRRDDGSLLGGIGRRLWFGHGRRRKPRRKLNVTECSKAGDISGSGSQGDQGDTRDDDEFEHILPAYSDSMTLALGPDNHYAVDELDTLPSVQVSG